MMINAVCVGIGMFLLGSGWGVLEASNCKYDKAGIILISIGLPFLILGLAL